MSENSWKRGAFCARKLERAERFWRTNPALEHRQPNEEAVQMSRCGYSGDSTLKFKTEQSVNGGAA